MKMIYYFTKQSLQEAIWADSNSSDVGQFCPVGKPMWKWQVFRNWNDIEVDVCFHSLLLISVGTSDSKSYLSKDQMGILWKEKVIFFP